MTGLFHRLAQLVVGAPPHRVRTEAGLPFAAVPPPEPRPVAITPPDTDAPAPPAARVERTDTHTGSAAGNTRQHSREATAPSPLLAGTDGREPDPPAVRAGTDNGMIDRPPPALREVTDREKQPDETPAPPPPAQAGTRAPLRRDRTPPNVRGATTAEAPRGAPEPLLPEVAATAAAIAPPAPRAAARQQAAADTGPPEVHVHIGRIDVTSVAEPQPARESPQRRGKPPMSLEDYLSKRRTGR